MKNRSKFIRIVALILAILMFGSVLVVAVQSFAASPENATYVSDTNEKCKSNCKEKCKDEESCKGVNSCNNCCNCKG